MLFTRTIRRKMLCSVALLLGVLITLSLTGISGLIEYRSLVHELKFSMDGVPRRSQLAQEIGQLYEVLLQPIPPQRKKTAATQQAEFKASLRKTKKGVRSFYEKLNDLPNSQEISNLRSVYVSYLDKAYPTFDKLEHLQGGLGDESTRIQTAQQMMDLVVRLQVGSRELPDFQDRLNNSYVKATKVLQSRFGLIRWTTAFAVIFFLGLVGYAYMGVYAPLKKLHQRACRVAQGDFDYRVELVAQDEIAELAESFN